MKRGAKFVGQAVLYALIGAVIAYFSSAPAYRSFAEGDGLIKLSFAHGGKRKIECRRRSRAELQKLAPNMRKPMSCPRERLPVFVRLEIDGRVLLEQSFAPTGISGDGPSNVYVRYAVPAGRHTLDIGMRDSKRAEGFDYSLRRTVDLAPRQNLAIQFRADLGKFVIE